MLNGVECVPVTKVHGSSDDPKVVIGQPSGTVLLIWILEPVLLP